MPTTRREPNGDFRCNGENVESSVSDIAGPSRRYRSYGQMNVLGLRSDSTAGFQETRREAVMSPLFHEFARVEAKDSGKHYRRDPNQALLPTPKLVPFLFFPSRQYGAADL